jgi:hypothetical protein
MKKIIFTLFLVSQIALLQAQDAKPYHASIHFAPVFESIQKLKTGFGTTIEGSYFFNDWFGTGGKLSYSTHRYTYSNFSANSNAGQYGFSGNVYILKKYFDDKISFIPSIGFGFTSTIIPSGTLTSTNLVQTAPGVYTQVESKAFIGSSSITSFMFNVFGIACNYNFRPDMSAGVNIEYQMSVANKWPDETLGDFFSIGIGYTYNFDIHFKSTKKQ